MLRGMDVFPTLCYYDTWGHGRVVLKHPPHFVVMMIVGFRKGESSSGMQLTLPLSSSLCGQVGEANIHFYTSRGRIGRMRT